MLNIPLLFILPNPSRTNTGVEANLLYVGVDLQVHKEHILGEEECANLHKDEEHHDYEAGGHSNDERWTWMQTEIERISTKQQRQGVEITRLRNDVLRGTRINEDNNQMLWNIMQHLHLQGPPYGPQENCELSSSSLPLSLLSSFLFFFLFFFYFNFLILNH